MDAGTPNLSQENLDQLTGWIKALWLLNREIENRYSNLALGHAIVSDRLEVLRAWANSQATPSDLPQLPAPDTLPGKDADTRDYGPDSGPFGWEEFFEFLRMGSDEPAVIDEAYLEETHSLYETYQERLAALREKTGEYQQIAENITAMLGDNPAVISLDHYPSLISSPRTEGIIVYNPDNPDIVLIENIFQANSRFQDSHTYCHLNPFDDEGMPLHDRLPSNSITLAFTLAREHIAHDVARLIQYEGGAVHPDPHAVSRFFDVLTGAFYIAGFAETELGKQEIIYAVHNGAITAYTLSEERALERRVLFDTTLPVRQRHEQALENLDELRGILRISHNQFFVQPQSTVPGRLEAFDIEEATGYPEDIEMIVQGRVTRARIHDTSEDGIELTLNAMRDLHEAICEQPRRFFRGLRRPGDHDHDQPASPAR